MQQDYKPPELIQNYHKHKEDAKKLRDTSKVAIANGYSAASDAARDKDGLVDWNILKDDSGKEKISKAYIGGFIGELQFLAKVDTDELNQVQIDSLMRGIYGFDSEAATKFIYNQKDELKFDTMLSAFSQPIDNSYEQNKSNATRFLSYDKRSDVIDYLGHILGTENSEHKTIQNKQELLKPEKMAKILDLTDEHGTVSGKQLEDILDLAA